MPDRSELDDKLERLREQVRDRQVRTAPGADPPLTAELRSLHALYDISAVPFSFHRRLLGRLLLPARWLVKELLTPVIVQQVKYNAANTRLVDDLKTRLDALQVRAEVVARRSADLEEVVPRSLAASAEQFRSHVEALGRAFARRYAEDLAVGNRAWRELNGRLDDQAGRMERLRQEARDAARGLGDEIGNLRMLLEASTAQIGNQSQALMTRLARAERHLRRMSEAGAAPPQPDIGAPSSVINQDPAIDYFAFQERFRGPASRVRERQAIYRQYFADRGPLLDLGCGRGEFLELMRESGTGAIGVDANLDMVSYCRGKGLQAVHDEAVSYLARQADESLGAIFAAQVAEHLTAAELARLVALAGRKLRRDGRLVVETLNPESIWVQYRWFWMDPTHTRLVHPQTLQFLFDTAGFGSVECQFLSPPEGPLTIPPLPLAEGEQAEQFNRATGYLNQVLFGSQEYFVAGTRPAV